MPDDITRTEAEATVKNSQGLHARPVGRFVDLASQFESAIRVQKGDLDVDGKSHMEMFLLIAPKGTVLRLVAEGGDAPAAVAALVDLIDSGFGEE
jgi:phosphocarrier protein